MISLKGPKLWVRVLPLLALLLAACAPAASSPTPVPTIPAATLTPAVASPTALPASPTRTATATNSPVPPTSTKVPSTVTPLATATATAKPTDTPTPGPGVALFDIAKDTCNWQTFGLDTKTGKSIVTDFTIKSDPGKLHVEVPRAFTSGYAVCPNDLQPDVQIDVDVQKVVGPNRNNVSLVCRLNDAGWYETSFTNGGHWFLYKYTPKNQYKLLASGASTAIHLQNAQNHLTLLCSGDTITFYANRVRLGSFKDAQFTRGQVAVSVATFDLTGVGVDFTGLKVIIPDPANPPGGLTAPTLVPTAAGGNPPPAGCRLTSYSLEMPTGNALIIHFAADGFAAGERVGGSAIGTGSDGNTVTLRQNFQANDQGHVEGELGALPLAVQSGTVTWAFNLEGFTGGCMINRSAVP